MAYDGLVVSASIKEFREQLLGGKIAKITQPEKDEIHLMIRRQKESFRLKLSVNPSLPLCCFTTENRTAPLTAPAFCMTLRKHIGNGSILSIRQPSQDLSEDGLERVILFEIEHLDEMGDLGRRFLSIELMGKHSNIILLREDNRIIDAIKRISASQSSVREVLPNREYFIPDASGKQNPLTVSEADFLSGMQGTGEPVFRALYQHFTGLSALTANEICYRAAVDPDLPANSLEASSLRQLYQLFSSIIRKSVLEQGTKPCILYRGEAPQDFSAIPLQMYLGSAGYSEKSFDSMSAVIETFHIEKDRSSRVRQKSTDLRKILHTLLERCTKKLSLQEKQLRDSESKDRFRIYGELLNTYGYSLQGGEKELVCENYYDGKEIVIPLRTEYSAQENAKRYFEKYDKLKRTEQNLHVQLAESRQELLHLQSILSSLDLAEGEGVLREIRKEMADFGFLKKSGVSREKVRAQDRAQPYHFVSGTGYDIYVGRNNYQNEAVSFRLADGGDLWFHAKNVPGSHVIVKTGGASLESLPDSLFEEAASLAAYFSSQRQSAKVDVDYTLRKNLRKVPNSAPGFVIYHTNYSMTVAPKLPLQEVKESYRT